ncbi:hypothetical protein HanRHA438_Chr02g0061041 [Helianthus annuus]|nr:hypothetical protein HanRHA438_Chr02g0061041 [Helianthus annuus]
MCEDMWRTEPVWFSERSRERHVWFSDSSRERCVKADCNLLCVGVVCFFFSKKKQEKEALT